jgi:hypothetical protein
MLTRAGFGLFHAAEIDFSDRTRNSFLVDPSKKRKVSVRGRTIELAPVEIGAAFCGRVFDTDILAIHKREGF